MVQFKGSPSRLGAPLFDSRWPNRKAIKVGFLAGRGNSSPGIAQILNDGTSAETIRTQLQRAELEAVGENRSKFYVPVKLTSFERAQLTARAATRGMSLDEWMRRVVIAAGIPDDLYDAVVPE